MLKIRLICLLAAFCLFFGTFAAADNNENTLVYAMNSHLVLAGGTVMDIEPNPFVYKSTCYVPVRFTIAILGGEVVYNASDNSISVLFKNKMYTRTLDDCIFEYNVSYLPAKELMKLLGVSISWNDGILVMSSDSDASVLAADADKYKNQLSYTGHYDVFEEQEYQKAKKIVSFSADAGCYDAPFSLELSTNLRGAVIHYTTDGSEPTQDSPVYTEPIPIYDRTYEPNVAAEVQHVVSTDFRYPEGPVFKGTVISARAFNSEGDSTKAAVNTYFVGADLKQRYGVKVISISAPFDSLFNPDTGIYTYNNSIQLSNKNECTAYMEIFDESNSRVISQPIGLRLNGAGSRILQQKSLRVYARENDVYENGDKKSIKYDLFGGKVTDITGESVKKYKRFILRNGGDDWGNFFMKDAVIQAICTPFDVDIQASENSVVFVNGEFFGFYRIRERYDDEYFQYHYKLADEKDAVLIQIANNPLVANISEGTEQDLEDFNSKLYFIINNDMRDSQNYAIAGSYFNTGSFIDYYIINVFFENMDWPHNNVKIWRNKNPENGDTRYKFILSDEDTAMRNLGTVYKSIYGAGSEMASKWVGKNSLGTLGYKINDVDCLLNFAFRALLKNYEFRTEFIRRYNDYLNTVFKPSNIKAYIYNYFHAPLSIRDEQRMRYPKSWCKSDTFDLDYWAETRPGRARKELENYFGFKTKVDVTFKANPEEGYICANSIELRGGTPFNLISPDCYTSEYYKNFPLWFRAVANYGYELDYFIVNGIPWLSSNEYVYNPIGKTTIEAVFKKTDAA